MNQNEFIKKTLGKPWVNRASSFDACDCWGLVVLYYKHVLDINIPTVQGFIENNNFEKCYQENNHLWEEVTKPITEGLVFTCYKGGKPTHVGICAGHGKVLHSRGSFDDKGSVAVHSIRSIEAVYGKMTYHKFIGNNQ